MRIFLSMGRSALLDFASLTWLIPSLPTIRSPVSSTSLPFAPTAEEQGLDLRLDAPRSPLEAHLQPEAVERIVTVLVDNALKFTEEGHVVVQVDTRDEQVVIAVTDTGIGMDEEARRLLFEPFRQASEGFDRAEEGLGLGLTLVGQLVELMEGTIEVDSEPGTGTRFEVRIPRGVPSKRVSPSSDPAPPVRQPVS